MKAAPLAALVCIPFLSACDANPFGGGGAEPEILRVGPGFSVATVEWDGTEAVTRMAYAVRDNGGRTQVCGAIATEGSDEIAAAEPQILNNTTLNAGETTIAPGLAFFARLGTVEEGTPAVCATTDAPWDAAYLETPPEVSVNLGGAEG